MDKEEFLDFPRDFNVDFFIVGAPKCGTTSIAYYLEEHPAVFFSLIKEPFYFNRASPMFNGFKSPDEYIKLFGDKAYDRSVMRGEGTTWYLYSQDAISNILKHNPDAKFIVCLRNPIEAAFSWFSQLKVMGVETLDTFEESWDAQFERKRNNVIAPVYGSGEAYDYIELFSLGTQVSRMVEMVPEGNIELVFIEDLKDDTTLTYKKILSFLGLEDDQRTIFPAKYERATTKSTLLRKLGSLMSYRVRVKLAYYMKLLGVDIYSIYLKSNTNKLVEKPSLPTKLRLEMSDAFSSEVKLLQDITGRNLQAWLINK